MPKRSSLSLEDLADRATLCLAFHRAAKGKADREEVKAFRTDLVRNLDRLQADILSGDPRLGPMRAFRIFDPKPRLIHAPRFRDRVLHHALIAHAGPVLENALVDDSFACRVGKGTIAAVERCQHFARRHAWYGQIDIAGYFPSIDHAILSDLLRTRFKNRGLLVFWDRLIEGHGTGQGRGLPIGALTSQHLANFYLAAADRFLVERCGASGLVRYMDDTVWWAADKPAIRRMCHEVSEFLAQARQLTVKRPWRVGRSVQGVMFCGFRILPGAMLLSRRRKARYASTRARWEAAFAAGQIGAGSLQAGMASALGMTAAADAAAWRAEQLRRVPLGPSLTTL